MDQEEGPEYKDRISQMCSSGTSIKKQLSYRQIDNTTDSNKYSECSERLKRYGTSLANAGNWHNENKKNDAMTK